MSKIKVIVVDDSFFMRQAIKKILESDGEIEVIAEAKNGKEAVELTADKRPDAVTMDIEMPVMTGIEALKKIMADSPVPVLMVSTLTEEGAEATIEALSEGAVDFVTKKPAFREMDGLKDELIGKVKSVAGSKRFSNNLIRQRLLRKTAEKSPLSTRSGIGSAAHGERALPRACDIEIVLVGVSTGGPSALQKLIPQITDKISAPIFIAQHMPPLFTESLAKRLDGLSKISVKEAEQGDFLKPGNAYIAPGGKISVINLHRKVEVKNVTDGYAYFPSVEAVGSSIRKIYGGKVLAIMLTGMGKDGSEAFEAIRKDRGFVMVQEPSECVVAGMPNAVINGGVADRVLSLDRIVRAINKIFDS